jgi:large subunit ribosomal protein L14e|tara:strand:+ start:124 stop:546 length:423 start_codon:yes stop_codon:yes gene_type:complete
MGKETETKTSLIGTLCVKLAGRDAGQIGVIVDELEDDYVLIDGSVRRRKCNIKHIETLAKKIDIKKGAEHKDVASELKKLGITVVERTAKVKSIPSKKDKKAEKKKEKVAAKKEKKAAKKVTKAKKPTLVPESKAKTAKK